MLTKLLKHEAKAISHIVLPLYGVALIAVALSKLIIVFGWFNSPQLWINIPVGFIFAFMVFSLLAVVFVSMLFLIMRFYKNLMGDEGYLMFTLPVSGTALLVSKLIAAVVTMLCSMVVVVGSVFFLLGGDFSVFVVEGEINLALLIPMLILAFILGLAVNFLLFYMSIAIGPQIAQNRLVGSIIAYVGIVTAMQIFSMVLIGIMGAVALTLPLPEFIATMSQGDIMLLIYAASVIISAIMGTVFFLITRHFITKKLNLQ